MEIKNICCILLLVSVITCSLQRSVDMSKVLDKKENKNYILSEHFNKYFYTNKNETKPQYYTYNNFAKANSKLTNNYDNMVIFEKNNQDTNNQDINNQDTNNQDTNNSLDFDDLNSIEIQKSNALDIDFEDFDEEIPNENLIKILKTNNSVLKLYDEGNPHSFIFNVFLFYSLLYIILIIYVLRIDTQEL